MPSTDIGRTLRPLHGLGKREAFLTCPDLGELRKVTTLMGKSRMTVVWITGASAGTTGTQGCVRGTWSPGESRYCK
jgi:hypothetical protein